MYSNNEQFGTNENSICLNKQIQIQTEKRFDYPNVENVKNRIKRQITWVLKWCEMWPFN